MVSAAKYNVNHFFEELKYERYYVIMSLTCIFIFIIPLMPFEHPSIANLNELHVVIII